MRMLSKAVDTGLLLTCRGLSVTVGGATVIDGAFNYLGDKA
jgi:hypothetical protein